MNRAAQHSPGPWAVAYANREIDVQYQPSTITDANGTRIMQFDTANHDANARLIAAAPTMLAALEYMVEYFDRSITDTRRYPEPEDVKRARAAIAAARGETESRWTVEFRPERNAYEVMQGTAHRGLYSTEEEARAAAAEQRT